MACPLLCLPKKDGSLRTIIDARNRNANTVLDVTPMPDMRSIMDSLARNSYRSKIDMTDTYEKIHVELDCVPRTAFATPWGMTIRHKPLAPLTLDLSRPGSLPWPDDS